MECNYKNKDGKKRSARYQIILIVSADPLVGSIASQYTQNREEHDRIARLWTKRYAT